MTTAPKYGIRNVKWKDYSIILDNWKQHCLPHECEFIDAIKDNKCFGGNQVVGLLSLQEAIQNRKLRASLF